MVKDDEILLTFNLGKLSDIFEFNVDTDGDDLYFKLNGAYDYYLGDNKYNEDARKINLEHNKLERLYIEHNNDLPDNIKVKVVVYKEE